MIHITPDVQSSINQSVLCWLATSSEDGQPNVSPKEIFTAWDDKLLVAQIASPQTIRNLKHNQLVCVSFVDVFVQKGFQIKGIARIVTRGDDDFESRHAILGPIAGPDFPFASLIEITIESVKPIISPRYRLFPDTTEEQQIQSALKTYGVRKR